jgi:protein-histidine pros-kinase
LKLIWKFNLVLTTMFVAGFVIAGWVSHNMLQANAREEVLEHARLMMEAALAARTYTNLQVKPLLEPQLNTTFLPQSIPSYAANEQFNEMRKTHKGFAYKEATLNPTNPSDRASDWEADLVQTFRQAPESRELIGERDTPMGRSMYLARPIQVKSGACLACHSTPDVAPKSMIALYGTANGFGWKMNEVVGAQVVSIPLPIPIARADATFRTFMLALAGIFAATLVMLNLMLHTIVIRRVTDLAAIADQMSLGNLDAGDFRSTSKDEIGTLTEALGRMKTSMVQALKMLEE